MGLGGRGAGGGGGGGASPRSGSGQLRFFNIISPSGPCGIVAGSAAVPPQTWTMVPLCARPLRFQRSSTEPAERLLAP